jgi:hemerythrin-like domain-containing protein
MLRDRSLIPLSHQHQHALALCVRLERALAAGSADLKAWQQEIEQHYAQEIKFHFAAEEQVLFPAASRFAELDSLVAELRDDHRHLRQHFAHAGQSRMNRAELGKFATLLSGHIRKEERKLFEALQRLLPTEEMNSLGEHLARTLEGAHQTCVLPQTRMPAKPKY